MWTWIVWAVVLLIQNASFTWVSRARNSGNIKYHAIAATGSNGVWFLSQIVVIGKVTEAIKGHDISLLVFTAAFYTVFTVIGSIGAHYVLMNHVEKGSRRVGA
jgi:hypothetical protein